MAVTTCWSVKGGAGTTVVAAGLALACPEPVTLIDLPGELPAVLGICEPAGQGLADWFASSAPPEAIDDLALDAGRGLRVVPRGVGSIDPDHERWAELAGWLTAAARPFVVDAGAAPPPPALAAAGRADDEASRRELLVVRPCYLTLRRACALAWRPDGAIIVDDHHHALTRADVARSIGVPVVAEIAVDPAVARAVDAGLLAARVPSSLVRPLRHLLVATERPAA
jgi:hypothetical protein